MHTNTTCMLIRVMVIRDFRLGKTVFKVAAFGLDASVKMSSPLLNCRVNHSVTFAGQVCPMQTQCTYASYILNVAQ